MHISQLRVENFRNLANQVVPLSDKVNLITGANGAGKTSMLEAIYYFGRQKSFRTSKIKELIQQGKPYFRIIGKTESPNHHIGIERREDLSTQMRLDRQPQKNAAHISKIVPVIAVTAHSFQLIDAGPAFRRPFIDYGTFHYHQHFIQAWQRYHRALKNRNAALKQKMPTAAIQSFDAVLTEQGHQLHDMRKAYFAQLIPILSEQLQRLNFPYTITLSYLPGWNELYALDAYLTRHFANDLRMGHTRYGPHRADFTLTVDGIEVSQRLSRGQQKTLILALYLSQIALISQFGHTRPLLIIDDIASEFDALRRNHLLEQLMGFDCQMFFSSTEADFFDASLRRHAFLMQMDNGHIR